MLGLCYKQTGELGKAEEFYLAAQGLKPGDLKVKQELASVYEQQGDRAQMITALRALLLVY